MQWSQPHLRQFRLRLSAAGLWPESRMARIACYFLGLGGVLLLLQEMLGLFAPSWGEHLGGWVLFLIFISAVLFSILAFRWLKKKLLWRLRNRLIVTYVFIGVIPVVLLLTLGFVTLYLFAGQFSGFVVTSDISSQLRSLEAGNAAIGNELAGRLERGENPTVESLAGLRKRDRAWARRQVGAWYRGKPVPLASEPDLTGTLSPPGFQNKNDNPYAQSIREGLPFREIVRDQGQLHLRVCSIFPVRSEALTVVTTEPLDKDLVERLAGTLGEVTLYAAGISMDEASKVASSTGTDPSNPAPRTSLSVAPDRSKGGSVYRQEDLHLTFTAGAVPASSGTFDREIQFGTPLRVVDWKTGDSERAGALVRVRTLPSVLYGHLFASLGDFAAGVGYILLGVGSFFLIIELIALFTGTRMTRTVTQAVAQLHDATKHVDRGDFSHRIPVRSRDQLSELALSFNSMTESIEKLILEQKEKQRLENELAIAQEVQAQLFPRQGAEMESLEVHGFCRPARTVSGDYYDFLNASSHKLILAVGDISGKGISAALLMATIHSAVRAYSMESMPQLREPVAVGAVAGSGRLMASWPEGVEVSPGALLSLLNHQLFESTPPEKYATLFLGIYDGRSHQLTYSNGGHLPPLLIGKDGSLRRLECGGTVVGLFDNMSYEEDSVVMKPGEIFVAYSDGVTEPENDFGEFGEARLIELVRENRHLPLAQISQAVTAAVDTWIGDNEQPDDVTLVLGRAR